MDSPGCICNAKLCILYIIEMLEQVLHLYLIYQQMLTDEVERPPLCKEKTASFNFKIIPPRLTPLCPEVAFKMGALSDPI